MDVIEKLAEATKILNEVDSYQSTLADRLSELDTKQQDILHYIEDNKIGMLWCYRLVNELKRVRLERRKIKNDMELTRNYKEMDGRMITGIGNRDQLMVALRKKERSLQTTYKNRQYSDEEIQNILRGREK